MNTNIDSFSEAPALIRRPRRSISTPKRPGRPARPWLRPRIRVPHPLVPHQEAFVTQEQAALWTHRSRQTVARWAILGECPDKALAALLAHYAHGMPPIPPELHGEPWAREWGRFRFTHDHARRDRRGQAQWVLVTPYSGETLNWVQVDACGSTHRSFEALLTDLRRWQRRAQEAEAEAARWRELVACA